MDLITPLQPGETKQLNQVGAERNAAWVTEVFQTHPFDEAARIVGRRMQALEIKARHYEKRATIDWLTDIPNRSAFETEFGQQISSGIPFILVYADADSLGKENNLRGHEAGNAFLTHIAKTAKRILWQQAIDAQHEGQTIFTGTDIDLVILARLSGDEYGAMFTLTDYDQSLQGSEEYFLEKRRDAFLIADAFREAVASEPIATHDQNGDEVSFVGTVSMGVGIFTFDRPLREFKTMVDVLGLNRAKQLGKNKTVEI